MRFYRGDGATLLVRSGLSTLGTTVETKKPDRSDNIVKATLNEAHRRGLACLVAYAAPESATGILSRIAQAIEDAIYTARAFICRWCC